VGKPERKRILWRHTLEDNIKIDYQEIGWGVSVDWIDLVQNMDR
jgi:hypothetical protein